MSTAMPIHAPRGREHPGAAEAGPPGTAPPDAFSTMLGMAVAQEPPPTREKDATRTAAAEGQGTEGDRFGAQDTTETTEPTVAAEAAAAGPTSTPAPALTPAGTASAPPAAPVAAVAIAAVPAGEGQASAAAAGETAIPAIAAADGEAGGLHAPADIAAGALAGGAGSLADVAVEVARTMDALDAATAASERASGEPGTLPSVATGDAATVAAETPPAELPARADTGEHAVPARAAGEHAVPARPGEPTAATPRTEAGPAPAPNAASVAADGGAHGRARRDGGESGHGHAAVAVIPPATAPAGGSADAAAALDAPAPAPQGAQPAAEAAVARAGVRLHELAGTTLATMRVAARNGATHARLTLRPDELGGVQINLRYHAGGVSADVVAESAAAAQQLAQAGADLRRSLEAQGVTVHRLDVHLAGDDRGGEASRERREAMAASHMQRAAREDDLAGAPDITIEASRPAPLGSRLDVLA
jgi:flagellar hook-length control protein FliK